MRLTEFCIGRPVTTTMFFLALLVLGLISSTLMPVDLFPEVTYPAVSISTTYTGVGPEEMERLITVPIEQAVATVNGIKSVTATSQEGSSRVTVNFDWGYDLAEAANDIRANLDRAKAALPDAASTPAIFKYDPSASPVLTLGLAGRLDQNTLRKLADDELSYLLQRVEGVAKVEVRGGKKQEIRIYLKQDRLHALGLTAIDVAKVLDSENATAAAGYLAVGVGDYLLRAKGELQNLDELRNLVVSRREGIPVYLKDIATVEEGFETSRSLVRIDGRPGVVLSISKRSGANTIAVADRIYQVIVEIEQRYPGLSLRVINDSSVYIRRAVASVSDSAVQGGILAALILLFFFHNLRATLITGITMPISILATLMLAYFFKMTLNTISLGGLALGVGMLVDNAVVVLDNIFRHYHQNGGDVKTAALEGTAEMGGALSSSTLTSICVFLPLIFLSGRNGIIFKELSYMVIFSLLCSLLVAVTLIPMLCARFLKVRDLAETGGRALQGRLVKLQHGWELSYGALLGWCLKRRGLVIGAGVGVFLLTLALYPFIGTELVQNTDEGVISVNLQLPTGTRLEETDRHVRALERFVRQNLPELANLEAAVGSRSGGGNANPHQGYLTLRLKAKALRRRTTQQVVDYLKQRLEVPGAKLRITIPNSMRFLYGGSQNPIAIDIRGYDQEQARQVAGDVIDTISALPGIINVNMSRDEERPELAIEIDRRRAADYGVTGADIAAAIEANIEGKVATTLRRNGAELEVRVNLQETDRGSWQDLNRIMVAGSNNRVVPLSGLVRLVQTDSPVGIERKDQERNVTVSAGLERRDLGDAMRAIQKAVAKIALPEGIKVFYAGDFEEQQQAAREFQLVIVLALLLVYMVMAAQFESFFDPFVIMLAVPFALSGVLLMLLLTDTLFNNQVYLGLIMLGGVVVNNAIVLLSYFRILLGQGLDLETAVINGSKSRLRPVLITTATTIFGLIPLALGLGEGAETQAPLARTVIGGLAFATVLTLVLIPVLFTTLESRLIKMKRWLRRSRPVTMMLLLLLTLQAVFPLRATAAAPVATAGLTVAEAVALALENNETGKILRTRQAIAEAAYRETMGAKAGQLFSVLESTVDDQEDDQLKLSLNAEKTVPVANLFGMKSLADQVAAANREVTLHGLEWEEQQFVYNVIAAFQQELLAKRALQLAEANWRRVGQTYEEVLTRAKLGLTTISDETGAAAQQAAARTSLNHARQLYRLARVKLRQWLGRPEDEELDLVEPVLELTQAELGPLLAQARQNRADLQEAHAAAGRAVALLKLARLSERLGISLAWELERDHFQVGAELSNLSSTSSTKISKRTVEELSLSGTGNAYVTKGTDAEDNAKWGTVTLTFKWTFWDGKVRREKIKQAELLVEQLEQTVNKTQKDLAYEVEQAYYNYWYLRDQLQSSELQLKYNRTDFEATQAKLRVGLAAVKDVLDAQVLLSQAEVAHEQVKTDLYLAQMELTRVCGRAMIPGIR